MVSISRSCYLPAECVSVVWLWQEREREREGEGAYERKRHGQTREKDIDTQKN